MKQHILELAHPLDNVVVAVDDIAAGDRVRVALGGQTMEWIVTDEVPFGCLVAARDIPTGQPIVRGGTRVGIALMPLRGGQRVDV